MFEEAKKYMVAYVSDHPGLKFLERFPWLSEDLSRVHERDIRWADIATTIVEDLPGGAWRHSDEVEEYLQYLKGLPAEQMAAELATIESGQIPAEQEASQAPTPAEILADYARAQDEGAGWVDMFQANAELGMIDEGDCASREVCAQILEVIKEGSASTVEWPTDEAILDYMASTPVSDWPDPMTD